MSDGDGWAWVVACLVAVLLVFLWFASSAAEAACKERGGHRITKYIYKGSLTLCISADGRILE